MKSIAAALILTSALGSTACSGTPSQPTPTPPDLVILQPQTASFAETILPDGSTAHSFTLERSGTVIATLTTSAPLDMSFFISRSAVGCTRHDVCTPLVRPNESKRLTYVGARGESIAFIVWHALAVGEPRSYSIDVIVQ